MDTNTITLTAEDMPLIASKTLGNGDEVVIQADSPDVNHYTVTRSNMGYVQWQDNDMTAADVVEACKTWGLDGWTAEA